MSFSVKITIQSDTRYITPLRQLVSAVAKVVGRKCFPRRVERSCTLALIEAVDNAIFHAHHHRRKLPIDVTLSVKKGIVTMKVADKGPGMNHPVVHFAKPLSTKGRGLYIISKLMDGVKSQKRENGHTVILRYTI